jgi:hypothetical protein
MLETCQREESAMNRVLLLMTSILVAAPLLAATQTFPGVTVLDHPGGGTIAYAQMPAQHTAQGAINRVMQYVTARFGATPKVTHVLKSKDGNSLAVTFTLKATSESPGDVTGLALVAVTASGPGKGAVLSDQSDRFGSTVSDMLQQMRQVAASAGAAPAAAAGAPTNGSAVKTPPTPAAMPTPASAAATGSTKAAALSLEPLHTTTLPDGSASLGLPDGWKISSAHAGEVIAAGPAPAQLHFRYQIQAYDPSRTPTSGRLPGARAIPYGADGATIQNLLTTQTAQMQHQTPPTVQILDAQQVAAGNYMVIASVSPSDGSTPFRAWTQIFVGPISPTGIYTLTMYQILLPLQVSADQANAAVKGLFGSYKANDQAIMAELANDQANTDRVVANFQRQSAANQAATERVVAASQRAFDSQSRSFAADDYALLGNTVVRDRDFNEHGLVSDNLADALTQADPNRFQEVPPSQYVQGVDY